MQEGTYQDYESVKKGFWGKIKEVGKKLPFISDVIALFYYMLDSEVPWYKKSIVVGALAYFISPIDAIPDLAPIIGYLDDAGVIAATVAWFGSELGPYYK